MRHAKAIARYLEFIAGAIAIAAVGAMCALASVCQPAEVGL